VLGIVVGAPGDPLVRVLLDDRGIELPPYARGADDPVRVGVADLTDRVNTLHEMREGLGTTKSPPDERLTVHILLGNELAVDPTGYRGDCDFREVRDIIEG
jgi:hypothetical protein